MKTVLCYGDSNTWGYDPSTEDRYAHDIRWTGVLAAELGNDYRVIEEGMNARTTVWDDPLSPYTNGINYLIPCLISHAPLDLVIIMLGSNDLKMRSSFSAWDIAAGAGMLVDIVQRSECGRDKNPPQVLLVSPPPVSEMTEFAEQFTGAQEKAPMLAAHFLQQAEDMGCAYLDAALIVSPSPLDGLHLDPEEHQKLGIAIAQKIISLFAD